MNPYMVLIIPLSAISRSHKGDSRKNVVERVVSECCDGAHAEVCGDCGIEVVHEILRGTKRATNLRNIAPIEVATALELENSQIERSKIRFA